MRKACNRKIRQTRQGAGSIDYILILGVIFPMLAVSIPLWKRMIQLVYEMMTVMISWPFL